MYNILTLLGVSYALESSHLVVDLSEVLDDRRLPLPGYIRCLSRLRRPNYSYQVTYSQSGACVAPNLLQYGESRQSPATWHRQLLTDWHDYWLVNHSDKIDAQQAARLCLSGLLSPNYTRLLDSGDKGEEAARRDFGRNTALEQDIAALQKRAKNDGDIFGGAVRVPVQRAPNLAPQRVYQADGVAWRYIKETLIWHAIKARQDWRIEQVGGTRDPGIVLYDVTGHPAVYLPTRTHNSLSVWANGVASMHANAGVIPPRFHAELRYYLAFLAGCTLGGILPEELDIAIMNRLGVCSPENHLAHERLLGGEVVRILDAENYIQNYTARPTMLDKPGSTITAETIVCVPAGSTPSTYYPVVHAAHEQTYPIRYAQNTHPSLKDCPEAEEPKENMAWIPRPYDCFFSLSPLAYHVENPDNTYSLTYDNQPAIREQPTTGYASLDIEQPHKLTSIKF